MRCRCTIGGEYRVGVGFRSGFGFRFGFRLGAGRRCVVVVRGVLINGGECLEGGSDGRRAKEGGRGSGKFTASMTVLRFHGLDWLGGLIFLLLFVCWWRFYLRWELE